MDARILNVANSSECMVKLTELIYAEVYKERPASLKPSHTCMCVSLTVVHILLRHNI